MIDFLIGIFAGIGTFYVVSNVVKRLSATIRPGSYAEDGCRMLLTMRAGYDIPRNELIMVIKAAEDIPKDSFVLLPDNLDENNIAWAVAKK